MNEVKWICAECGAKYCNHSCRVATWHEGFCSICQKKTAVTEPRDFGGLSPIYKDLISKMFKIKNGKK